MKEVLLGVVIVGLVTASAPAALVLGYWEEGDPKSTHQSWDFMSNVTPGGPYMYDWTVSPADDTNNHGSTVAFVDGQYNGQDGFFDPVEINFIIEVANYPEPRSHKEIWVDIEYTGVLVDIGGIGSGVDGPYLTEVLDSSGPRGLADYGYRIWPNPSRETLWGTILAPRTGGSAEFNGIHIDTICVPEPFSVALLAVGGIALLKRRRS